MNAKFPLRLSVLIAAVPSDPLGPVTFTDRADPEAGAPHGVPGGC